MEELNIAYFIIGMVTGGFITIILLRLYLNFRK
jgi:hypothetical protein